MDNDLKKKVLRKLTYGMWVLATGKGTDPDDLEASSVTWVTQVSFQPPLVAVAIKADSHLATVVGRHRAFTLHLLSSDQKDVASAFTKPTAIGDGTIGGHAWQPAPVTGAPVLEGFSAWLELRVTDVVERGDHWLFVGEVVGVGATDPDAAPFTLAQAGWFYGG